MEEYTTIYDNVHDTITAMKKNNSDKTFTFHISSEFPEYSLVPSNLYLANDGKIIFKNSKIPDNWVRGNFFTSNYNYRIIRRLNQYEYDKACFNGQIKTKNSDNAKFYNYVMNKLEQL